MAYPSVSYTFSNSTTADATQVNQNFTDLINGLSDGTKDLSISAITAAGNATFNGNTTIGNASSDDFTLTASLASSIPLKTHNSYDIGSVTTLGLRAIYFASSSATKTAKLLGPAISSDVTLTLPSKTATIDVVPTVSSVQSTTYSILTTDDIILYDTSGGAFTTTLPTAVSAAGKRYTLVLTAGGNALTIATTSAQTIASIASGTIKMGTTRDKLTVVSDGTNWQIVTWNIYLGARYSTTAGQSIADSTLSTIDFGTKTWDPWSVVTTGASWVFTAPITGYYLVTVRTCFQTGMTLDTGYFDGQIQVNSSNYSEMTKSINRQAAAEGSYTMSAVVLVTATQTIRYRVWQSNGASRSLTASGAQNSIEIQYLGY